MKFLPPIPGVVAIALLLLAQPALADGEPADEEPLSDERWREEHVVAIEVGDETDEPVGTTITIIDPEAAGGVEGSLTRVAVAAVGVSENGQGGLFQNVSVRGVSRQRVGYRFVDVRLTSERRAGASMAFIDPLLLGTIEVIRGPATTIHGSGALGGVVRVLPRDFAAPLAEFGYAGNGNENYQLFGTGGDNWSVGLSRGAAGDAEAADGTRLHTQYTRYSAVAKGSWSRGRLRYDLLAVPSLANDVGKASSDYPDRTTDYPRMRHGLVEFAATSEAGWRAHSYVHAHDLETQVVESDSFSRVENETLDYGLGWAGRREANDKLTVRYGVDLFGRANVNADEFRVDVDGAGNATTRTNDSLDDASETEAGVFGSVRWGLGKTRLEGGGRLLWDRQKNTGNPTRDQSSWSGFFGVAHPLGDRLEIAGSLSRGLRFPSLTERFFTGTTGRGEVVGNPDLIEESSRNVELSMNWVGTTTLVSAAVFHNFVSDYIERLEVTPGLLTFRNLTSGTIRGIEAHGIFRPGERWTLSVGGQWQEGRDSDDRPLADVPADEIFLGVQRRAQRWDVAAQWSHRAAKDDFGSGEMALGSADILFAQVDFRLADRWSLALSGDNLLDELYFRSADDKAPWAQGRTLALRLSWRQVP